MSDQHEPRNGSDLHALYANYFRIGHNAFEFFLDFGQRQAESGQEVFHTRIITSPEHLDAFLETLLHAAGRRNSGLSSESEFVLRPVKASGSRADLVLESLELLDQLLKRAYTRAQEVYEREESGEPRPLAYRGLQISREEAAHLLTQPPGAPAVSATASDSSQLEAFKLVALWDSLSRRYDLTAFDHAVAVLALAPEVDLRYERIYAYLQDDVTRRRPTVSLALDVLCPTAQSKLEWRSRFAPDAPLIRSGLLRLTPDPNHVNPSWLDHYLSLDEQAIAHVLGDAGLPARLSTFCQVVAPGIGKRLQSQTLEGLVPLIIEAREHSKCFPICFHGPRGTRQREAAEALASAAGASLLVADFSGGVAAGENAEANIRALYLEATLRDAILYLDGVDALLADTHRAALAALLRALDDYTGVTILGSAGPWISTGQGPRGILNVPFSLPDFDARRAVWQAQMQAAGFPDDPATLDALAGRFILTQDQIAEAVATARNRLSWIAAVNPGQRSPAYAAELMAAARAQTGQDLATLAVKVKPVYQWKDIVLPQDAEDQLHEICDRVGQRHRVLDAWGFDKKLSQGKGVAVLFTGPSGSGKTMAAEVIANGLGIDMYKIDLSGVVSKYIGETEKNLERIFSAAERTNAILFFDEADALFGKRSEVHDAHDRYANIEISYLLQRMEQYDGIAILATNLRGNLDEAFVRRLAYTVRFPLPGEAERLKIWQQIWPSQELLAPDVDLARLAAQFKLSGGNIRNVALSASFFAATEGSKVTMAHLIRALSREYEKVGKTVSQAELNAVLEPESAR